MDLQVLVVGGGIHGVGVLHDLASRGIRGVHLAERGRLASGTSSRSTKLLHGGLRYLEHPGQWGLVREALRERTILLEMLRGVAQPLPIVLTCPEESRSPWLVRAGLWLYDRLAGVSNLPSPRRLSAAEARELAPYLPAVASGRPVPAFLYYDALIQDDAVVRLVAALAVRLGASYAEHTFVETVSPISGGFRAQLRGPGGHRTVTARAVVNAAGAWCTSNLLRWGLTTDVVSVLNVGSHLLFRSSLTGADPGRSAAALFQNDDGRVVFFIPWFGRWLLGTTESVLAGDPDALRVPEADRAYLLRVARQRLGLASPEEHLAEAFAGIRTLPVGSLGPGAGAGIPESWRQDPFSSPLYLQSYPRTLSAMSREAVLDETVPGLLSVYGGKYTTYRALCERIGDRLVPRLGTVARSATRDPASWPVGDIREQSPEIFESDPSLRC